jgi:hypothetical protein
MDLTGHAHTCRRLALNEIDVISKLEHRNVVRMKGNLRHKYMK